MFLKNLAVVSAISLCIGLSAMGQKTDSTPPPLSVCEVQNSRSEYDGKLVKVRGVWTPGSHGILLVAACDGDAPPIWIQNITTDYEERDLNPQAFDRAEIEIGVIRSRTSQATGVDYDDLVTTVTYYGLFEADAYGPSVSSRGQLFVLTVSNVSVEPIQRDE